MSIDKGLMVKAALLASLPLVLASLLGFLFAEGVLPPAKARIAVEAPLYPSPFYYEETYIVAMGRGLYTVTIHSNSSLSICLVFDNTTVFLEARKGDVLVRRFWVEDGSLTVRVLGRGEPYQRLLGVIGVERSWR